MRADMEPSSVCHKWWFPTTGLGRRNVDHHSDVRLRKSRAYPATSTSSMAAPAMLKGAVPCIKIFLAIAVAAAIFALITTVLDEWLGLVNGLQSALDLGLLFLFVWVCRALGLVRRHKD